MSTPPTDLRVELANWQQPDQIDAVVHLLNTYACDPMGSGHALPADVQARLRRDLPQQPDTLVFLAHVSHQPAALAVCFRVYSTFAACPVLNVHDLVVAPAFRQQGLGHTLLNHIINHARRAGCSKLTLEVRHDNAAAQRLYRSLGFAPQLPGQEPMAFWQLPL